VLEGALATSAGDLPFDRAQGAVELGPGGCVTKVSLALGMKAGGACGMQIIAGPAFDANGNLVITSAVIKLGDCANLPMGVTKSATLELTDGSISFLGVSCPVGDRWTLLEAYCSAGPSEIRLTGEIRSPDSPDVVTLTGAPLRFSGNACGDRTSSACPSSG